MRASTAITVFVLLASTVAGAAPTAAQDWKGVGRIEGRVLDKAGQPVDGAEVTARWMDVTFAEHTDVESAEVTDLGPDPTTTDKKGAWTFSGLRPGVWQVRAFHPDHGTTTTNVRVYSPYTFNQNRGLIVKLVLRGTASVDPRKLIKEGEALLANGQPTEARDRFEAALPLLSAPDRAVVLSTIARTHYMEGDVTTALDRLREAADLDPANTEIPQVLTKMLLLQKQPTAALKVAERFVDQHPSLPEAYFQRAEALISVGRTNGARKDLAHVLELQDQGPVAEEARRRLSDLERRAAANR